MTTLDQALRREAVRLFERYAIEVVEEFGLCPWAAAARQRGEVRCEVVVDAAPSAGALAASVDALAADDAVTIGIVIAPRLSLDAAGFRRLAGEVAAEHARRCGGRALMAIADFHPDAARDEASAARLIPWLRRTPDPTLQLIRLSVLADNKRATAPPGLAAQAAALAGAAPPPTVAIGERVAAVNATTVAQDGARLAAAVAAIHADRARTYAALLAVTGGPRGSG